MDAGATAGNGSRFGTLHGPRRATLGIGDADGAAERQVRRRWEWERGNGEWGTGRTTRYRLSSSVYGSRFPVPGSRAAIPRPSMQRNDDASVRGIGQTRA